MAIGPDHYLIAEQLADDAARAHDNGDPERMQALLGLAQVHATLALAGATALNGMSRSPRTTEAYWQWEAIAIEQDA
jgi:hypothetical protein